VRRVKHRLDPPALILIYHRVLELHSDPQLLAVTLQHFSEHLEVLRKHARPYRLEDFAKVLRGGQLPRRAVAITLDDGYADNLLNAEPILRAHEIPATVFVTAGHVGNRREFWWDELDRILLQPGALPEQLQLSVQGRVHRWRLDGAAAYDQQMYESYRDWHIERMDDPTPRHALYRAIYFLLHDLAPEEREPILDEMRRWARVSDEGRTLHRTLAPDELVKLSASAAIDIGAHTVTHPVLPAQPACVQRREIVQSKARLEEILRKPINGFAYPHGAGTPETAGIVRDAGFEYACSTAVDVVRRNPDLFTLPRLGVRDWDADTFLRFLSYWLDG